MNFLAAWLLSQPYIYRIGSLAAISVAEPSSRRRQALATKHAHAFLASRYVVPMALPLTLHQLRSRNFPVTIAFPTKSRLLPSSGDVATREHSHPRIFCSDCFDPMYNIVRNAPKAPDEAVSQDADVPAGHKRCTRCRQTLSSYRFSGHTCFPTTTAAQQPAALPSPALSPALPHQQQHQPRQPSPPPSIPAVVSRRPQLQAALNNARMERGLERMKTRKAISPRDLMFLRHFIKERTGAAGVASLLRDEHKVRAQLV